MTDGAGAVIAREDLVAEVARVGAETPLVNAIVAAKGASTFGNNFEIAPAAERKVVRAFWKRRSSRVASCESASGEHAFSE